MSNEKLYILTYDHGGYVLWKDAVKPRLKDLFNWLEKYPKLRIGLDYESFTFDEFSKEDPEIVELSRDLLKKYPDRVGLGATTYGQPLSLTICDESNARQLTYAIRTNLKYFGKTPSVYAISEFALNNQTPQLISLCGYKAAILRSHVMGYGYPKTFDSSWGTWVGRDGTRIPAVPTYDGQGRGYNCTTVDNWILSRWPVDSTLYSLEDFKERFKKYSPLLATRYDDLTQPIEEITKHIETKDDYEYILLEDVPTLFGEPKDEYITEDNDFHVQMPWGYCGNEIFNGCRKGESSAIAAEKLNALSTLFGGKALQEKLDEAWQYTLAAEHHDVTICGLLDLSRRFIPTSLNASEGVKAESLKVLADTFKSKNDDSLVVVNPHSFAINEWVEIECDKKLCAFDNDEKLKCENVVKNNKNTLRVFVSLDSMSIKRLTLKPEAPTENDAFLYDSDNAILKTPYYEVKLTENGISYIKSILDNSYIVNNEEKGLLSAFINNEECVSKGSWTLKINPFSAVALYKGTIGSVLFTLEMSFLSDDKKIDCSTSVTVKKELIGRNDITEGRPVSLTVNGHHHSDKLCFNLNVCVDKNRKMFRDLPYSISEWNGALRKTEKYWYPDDDILIDTVVSPEESFNSTTNFHGIYWLCLRDENKGVAVINNGCMGCALKGNYLSIPLIYSNDYLCGTKILDGVYTNEFSILPFSADYTCVDIHKKALCFNEKPSVVFSEASFDGLDEFTLFSSFKGDVENVVLTTIYPENDYILARFCNFSENEANIKLELNNASIIAETDLLGNNLKDVSGNELEFHPWEIKTIKLVKE